MLRNARKRKNMSSRDGSNNREDNPRRQRGKQRSNRPPNLRGKEIGLYYRDLARSKKEKLQTEPAKPIADIIVSNSRQHEIKSLLENVSFSNEVIIDDGSYDHVKDSKFKREFLNIRNGNIEQKLQKSLYINIKRNTDLDEELYNQLMEKREKDFKFKYMQNKRAKLPSFNKKDEILKLVDENQVVVVSGETGCGKTTQVAQFILDDYIEKKKGSLCRIVCTQPRRISAISVAERVAEERCEPLGMSSGYHIRLERRSPRTAGSVCFCTTGVILKQMESDPCLSEVSHIILDEIHERDVMSDFIITLLKSVIATRKDLKVILMSATLNSEQFSVYYNNCAQINIPGFTYPVTEYYLEDILTRVKFSFQDNRKKSFKKFVNETIQKEFADYVLPYVRELEKSKSYPMNVINELRNPSSEKLNINLIFELILDICQNEEDPGAILVFLTGLAEISDLDKLMEKSGKFPRSKYLIIPLHSMMPTIQQKQVFDRPRDGIRKIILSTNIAETSITIDDVVFVINCGFIKMKNFNVETNTQTLQAEWVSQANANQRRGRAGRVQAGKCFHLYTKARGMILEKYQKPEVLRTRLEDVILSIKVLQLGLAEPFLLKLMDTPDPAVITLSITLLKQLNALDSEEKLTPLGYHLAKLPMGPQMGKMILLSAIFSCVDPILSVAASLDFKDAFQVPLGKERAVDSKKLELSNGFKSDHLILHEALKRYEDSDNQRHFCWEYFLSIQTLKMLVNMKKQFMHYLYDMNFVPSIDPKSPECNLNSDNTCLIKAIICAGLYPNVVIAKNLKKRVALRLLNADTVKLHPKSILTNCNYFESPLLVYYLMMKSSASFIHDATMIWPLPLIFFGEKFLIEQNENSTLDVITVADRLKFRCSAQTTRIIKELRNRLNWFLEYKISHPGFVDWRMDSDETKILRAIMELIASEDMGNVDIDDFDDD